MKRTMTRRRIGVLWPRPVAALCVVFSLLAVVSLPGCHGEKEVIRDTPAAPPGSTFIGPAELRGTIGSQARLEGREPLMVSRYGLVVNLDGTGSPVVPAYLETWMANEMRKMGVGSRSLSARHPEWERMTPQRMLRDPRTAVVRVSGLIPPGASPGTRFDLLVEALPEDNGTTSLAGGQLWQTSLGVFGDDTQLPAVRQLAVGRGPVYISPFQGDQQDAARHKQYMRQAVIVGGGIATEPRRLEIVLNQASWARARQLSDTINERFRMAPNEAGITANAVGALRIELTVPRRYRDNPEHLLDLISHTYPYPVPVQGAVDEMVTWMERDGGAEVRRRAGLVIKALGRNAAPALTRHYDHEDLPVRLALLEAGAYLGDTATADRLVALSTSPDPDTRIAVARSLVHLPRNLRGSAALRALLSDAELDVRLTAYETLAAHGDPMIDSLAVSDLDGVKFVIDRVPSDEPMVYITAQGTPRIVLFDPYQGFRQPVVASVWNNRMSLQSPLTIPQAAQGLELGNVAFLPVTHRGPVQREGDASVATLYDARGGTAKVRASNEAAAVLLREALPEAGDEGERFAVSGRVVENLAGRLTVELLGVEDTLDGMPVSVFYRSPFEPRPTIHRVAPTVATLAFFLAHYPTMEQPQEGLNLTFGQVVDALYQLRRQGTVRAPVELHLSPLARMIADLREDQAPHQRPESDGNAPGRPEPTPTGDPLAAAETAVPAGDSADPTAR